MGTDQLLGFSFQNFFQCSIHSSSVHLTVVGPVVSRFAISIIHSLYASRDLSFGRDRGTILYGLFAIEPNLEDNQKLRTRKGKMSLPGASFSHLRL